MAKTQKHAPPTPKLQPPGAGLPLIQKFALRLWFGPILSKRTPRERCREDYEFLTEKLIALLSKQSEERRMKKVLIAPLAGLEDSSRFWSLNEVIEHLLMVTRQIEKVILSLASGKIPSGKADTAKVKPGKAKGDLLKEFLEYAPKVMEELDSALGRKGMNFESRVKFRHPWFGEITARQWYWLLGMHQGIHYRQAKLIVKGLTKG